MAFLKYRGSTTEPGVWTGTVANNAALTNLDIDKNFKSLDAQKLENSGYAAGAIIYAGAPSGALTSLPVGVNGNVLKLVSGVPSWQTDTGTKYDVKAVTTTGGAFLRLTGSDSTNDDVKIASGTNITVAYTDDNTITISAGAATTLANDTTTNATYYPLFTTVTSGNLTVSRVSNTKLTFNPSSGDLGATNFNSLSDVRFKKDLEQISGALNKVKQLTGYTYTLIEENVRSSGLTAQDVEQVLPEAVGGNDERKTLAYGSMMGLIVEAIKELDSKLENIQSQLLNK